MNGHPVTVIGAGIAGLAAAIALAQRGAAVRVLEQTSDLREVGAGIQISPNGGVVLSALGLSSAIEANSMASKAVVLRDYASGVQVLRMALDRLPRFSLLHRADLIRVLADGASQAGVAIETGVRVAAVEVEGAGPVIIHADGRQESIDGLLIGADGLHSRARAAILGGATPKFTGQVAWRAIVPASGAGAPSEAHVFMGPGQHVVAYPLRGSAFVNLVAVEERQAWTEEGWANEGNPDALRSRFSQFSDPVRSWLDAVESVKVWGLFRHPIARRWYKGTSVLVGDAAHPTLPFLAQGACMALEDVWALARAVDQLGPTRAALAKYQLVRRDRVQRIVAAATANARNYHLRHPVVRGLAHGGLRLLNQLAPQAALGQYRWLYDYDVTKAEF